MYWSRSVRHPAPRWHKGVFLNGELCGDRARTVAARDEDVRRVTERVVDDGDVHTPIGGGGSNSNAFKLISRAPAGGSKVQLRTVVFTSVTARSMLIASFSTVTVALLMATSKAAARQCTTRYIGVSCVAEIRLFGTERWRAVEVPAEFPLSQSMNVAQRGTRRRVGIISRCAQLRVGLC